MKHQPVILTPTLGEQFQDDEFQVGAQMLAGPLIGVWCSNGRERHWIKGSPSDIIGDPERFDHNLKLLLDKAGVPRFSRYRGRVREGLRQALNIV